MNLLVPERRDEPEWMDRDDVPAPSIEAVLREIAWVNRRLGGARVLLEAIDPFLEAAPPDEIFEILDVGTGGGDLASAMIDHGRHRGRRVRVTAIDRDPAAAAFAARSAPDGLRVVRADAAALPFPDQSFDLVTASLFLHHFRHREAAALLAAFRRLARRAVIINDLERHRLPWVFINLVGRATRRSPMFLHDAPLSVLRGFTQPELLALARDAGAPESTVQRSWPFRLLLVLPPDAPPARGHLSYGQPPAQEPGSRGHGADSVP